MGVGGVIECAALYGIPEEQTLTCTVTSETTVSVAGLFPVTENFIMIAFYNIQNPSIVTDMFTQIISYGADDSIIETSSAISFGLTYDPSYLVTEIVTAEGESQVVGEYVNVAISFTPVDDLDNNSKFYLE
jgi:hypothetical protein